MDSVSNLLLYGGATILGTNAGSQVGAAVAVATYTYATSKSEDEDEEKEKGEEELQEFLRVMRRVEHEYRAILAYFPEVYQRNCRKEAIASSPTRQAKLLKRINEKSISIL